MIRLKIVLGVTGASGAAIAVRIAERLSEIESVELHLVLSPAAHRTLAHEVGADAFLTAWPITSWYVQPTCI